MYSPLPLEPRMSSWIFSLPLPSQLGRWVFALSIDLFNRPLLLRDGLPK